MGTAGAASDPEQPRAEDFALQLARLEGELKARDNHLAAMEATYEAHRAEWQAALAEAADARVALRDGQVRVEDWRALVADMRARLQSAEEALTRAGNERSAVIAALGRKARRQLD
jgi:predicted  nucleic acid-binding Zn-ribbon protein